MQVIVHGGAGGAPDEPEPRQRVLDEAATAGTAESTPRDAVEVAIKVLEESPRFNAGVGGAVQSDGVVRTDAGLMGDDREVGAACSMPGVAHAVSAARVVAEETPHVLVSGEHAVDLAADFGVETDVDLLTDENRERYEAADPPADCGLASTESDGASPREHLDWLADKFGGTDTVGAVAVDPEGPPGQRIAAATSTGGRWFALAGRVGDVPQVGSGFYAGPAGGASATGAGEDIARVTLTRLAVDHLEDGQTAQSAADEAMDAFDTVCEGTAGIIVLGADGTVGEAYTSEAMQTAHR